MSFKEIKFVVLIASMVSAESLEITLDIAKDVDTHQWGVSNTTLWPDWFSYFDNLKEISEEARTYFKMANFTNLDAFEEVEGIWVAFNTTLPPTSTNPYPHISYPYNFQIWELEIYYYVHNDASILLKSRNETIVPKGNSGGWLFYNTQIGLDTLELITTSQKDFVIIDKVILKRFDPPSTTALSTTPSKIASKSTTPITTSTPPPSTTSTTTLSPTDEENIDDSGSGSLQVSLTLLFLYFFTIGCNFIAV